MSYFNYAVAFTLRPENEGGYVNDPADPGGATNYGVTQKTLNSWLYRKGQPSYDVADLAIQTAQDLYFELYWKPYALDQVTKIGPAIALFDAGVLFGPGTAVAHAQKALAAAGFVDLLADGVLGPKTLAAINGANSGMFLKVFVAWLKLFIAEVVQDKPALAKFQNGWEARVSRYLTLS